MGQRMTIASYAMQDKDRLGLISRYKQWKNAKGFDEYYIQNRTRARHIIRLMLL